jgi:hypothetical protein
MAHYLFNFTNPDEANGPALPERAAVERLPSIG